MRRRDLPPARSGAWPCSLHASRRWIVPSAFSDRLLPLTPALSLRERENHIPHSRKPTLTQSADEQTAIHPLPWGEGRGEGQRG
jgi:hypothetical protein